MVIPCDDGVVLQLHALHELEPSLRSLIERSIGPPESYSVVESRHQFLSTAAGLGIRVPRMRRIEKAEDIPAWLRDVPSASVLKVDGESGGNGVRISQSPDESAAAWRELHAPCSRATAWKRLIIDRDPLALWLRRRQMRRGMMVQEYIPGRPANCMAVCWRGELLSLVSVIVVAAEGPTGAAIVVRVVRNQEIKEGRRARRAKFALSGFFGLDFILKANTDEPYLIELNPRCTQLGHLELEGDGCPCWCLLCCSARWTTTGSSESHTGQDDCLVSSGARGRDDCRPYVEASYHDVPCDEPHLMSELKKKSWPQRQWAARIYHAFRPWIGHTQLCSRNWPRSPHKAAKTKGEFS